MAGGLRIRKMSFFDKNFPSAVKTREYFYVNGYRAGTQVAALPSSGVLGGQARYYFDDYRMVSFNDNNVVYSKSVFSSQSVLPACNNAMGSFIGYSQVTEKREDSSYVNYYYSNFDNGHVDEASPSIQQTRTAYDPYSSVEQERGLLTAQETVNSSGTLLERKTVTYSALNKANAYVPALMARYFNACPNTAVSVSEAVAYKNYTYSYLPSVDTTVTYDGNGNNPVVSVNKYTYNTSYRLPVNQVTVNSKGDSSKTAWKYAFDSPTGVYSTMLAKNMLSPVVEQAQTYYRSSAGSQTKLQRVNYAQFTTKNLVLPQSVQEQNFGATLDTVARYYAYDTSGNVLDYQKRGAARDVFLWGYNGEFPVAHIKGASYAAVSGLVSQAQVNTAVSQGDASLRTLTRGLRAGLQAQGAQTTSYTHAPGVGITSETSPEGRNTFYEYDGFARLLNLRDDGSNIVRKYAYLYRPEPPTKVYLNAAVSAAIAVNTCPSYQLPADTVLYIVPQGRYGSTVSQTSANQQAQNDINANGQGYANAVGHCCVTDYAWDSQIHGYGVTMERQGTSVKFTFVFANPSATNTNVFTLGKINSSCQIPQGPRTIPCFFSGSGALYKIFVYPGGYVQAQLVSGTPPNEGNPVSLTGTFDIAKNLYYNDSISQSFVKNDCAAGNNGSSVVYTVQTGKYWSATSQTDANQQAQTDLSTNGQSNANSLGTCTPNITLTPNSNVTVYTATVTLTGNTFTFRFVFSGSSGTLFKGGLIGNLSAGGRPTANRSVTVDDVLTSGRKWTVSISTNGDVNLTLASGSVTTSTPPINVTGTYSK